MKVLDSGHHYQLHCLDGDVPLGLYFVKREGPGYPPSEWTGGKPHEGSHPGTLIQDVVRCCIDRLQYVDGQIRDERNLRAIHMLRGVIRLLEERACDRHGRPSQYLFNTIEVEFLPICERCGHTGCQGECGR